MFTHLHGHSHYSLLEAIGKPKEIVNTAKELGMEAVALTDYSGLYGAIEFYQACKKAEIKPILGVEIGFTIDLSSKQSHGTIVLIAPTTKEYHQLLTLTSHANMEGYTSMATIDLKLLQEHGDGLICLVGGHASLIAHHITHQTPTQQIVEQLTLIKSALGDKGFMALELTAWDHSTNKTVAATNTGVIEIAELAGLDVVITGNYHYVSPDQELAFETALSIKDGKRIYDEDRRRVTGKRHIQSEEEIRNVMKKNGFDDSVIETGIAMTQTIADRTDLTIELNQLLFPNYQSPEDIVKLYEENKEGLVITK